MEGREKYLARQAEKSRPFYTKSYEGMTSRDDIREFARSPYGQNYNRIQDLQVQLPNMDRNDPRVQELKQRRRFHNRFGKDIMGDVLAMSPQAVRDDYVKMSGDVRRANKPVFNKMYPFTGAAMDYIDAGGLPGIIAQTGASFLENVSDFGRGLFEKKGITGNVDTNEEEMQDYATQTFGFDGTTRPFPQQDFFVDAETFRERDVDIPRMDDDVGDFYEYDKDDNIVMSPDRPMPFDDSNREAGIMSQYPGTNFIGPRDDPNRRPTMADVAGPMYPGLIPFPEYGPGIVYTEGRGRGDLPMFGFDYDDMRKRITDEYRMREALKFLDEKEEPQPSRMNLR